MPPSANTKTRIKPRTTWKGNLLKRAQSDWTWWIETVLGDTLWDKQKEIVKSVTENERTAVKSVFSVGKSFVAARIALAFLYNHSPSRVITTSSTWRQVREILWAEIRTAHAKSKVPLGGECLTTTLRLDNDRFALGFSTDDSNIDLVTGFHAPHQLVIFDQAGGIPPGIWDAAEFLMTSAHVRWLALSNTAVPVGAFADICIPDRKSKHGKWNIITITAHDSPNVKAGRNIYPGQLPFDFVDKKKQEWGVDDPLYRIAIEAEFVPESQMSVFPYYHLVHVYDREGEEDEMIDIGLDVATQGVDSTVWLARSGERALELKRVTGNNEPQIARATIEFIRYVEAKYNKPIRVVKVDAVGPGGGVASILEEKDVPVIRIINQEVRPVVDKERYSNVRAEMAWAMRHRIENKRMGIAAIHTEEPSLIDLLKSDLQVTRYKITPAGKIQIVPKDELKAELGRSPDYYDACVMAFEEPGGGPPGVSFLSRVDDQLITPEPIFTDEEWDAFMNGKFDLEDPSFHSL